MEEKILMEISKLRTAIAKVVGTSNKSSAEQFSKEALDKAALEFQKLSIERGEWIEDSGISKIIKSAPWYAGKFIREQFKLTTIFRKGGNIIGCFKRRGELYFKKHLFCA